MEPEKRQPQNLYEAMQMLSPEKEEKVAKYLETAEKKLEEIYGVTNLSIIEKGILKEKIVDLLPKYEEDMKMVAEGKMSEQHFAHIEEEAGALWLYEACGIHPNNIHWEKTSDNDLHGKVAEADKEYIRIEREKHHHEHF